MKNINISAPVIVAQSTTEPILHGGYQDPFIKCAENGDLYVKFSARKDCVDTFGLEHKNPVYKSCDKGKTWLISSDYEWKKANPRLPNGDILVLREHKVLKNPPPLPEFPENRERNICEPTASIINGDMYKADELIPAIGEEEAGKFFYAERLKSGETEFKTEKCKVNWDNMPIQYSFDSGTNEYYLKRIYPSDKYKIDSNGVIWMPVHGGSIAEDGSMNSRRLCTHLLRSDDCGYTWDYVSTVVYREEYNNSQYGVEGFDEATVEITADGSIIMIMRSGSLYPFGGRENNAPIPKIYYAKSTDEGKTWDFVKPFYDYGIRPQSVKLECGTIIMISGRPDVYIRLCEDPKGEKWEEAIHLMDVPEENVENIYYEYTCANSDICAGGVNTAYIAYSDFQLKTPGGERAKSILVSKITIE